MRLIEVRSPESISKQGCVLDPKAKGIWDNYLVKKNQIQSAPLVATQLLLVDEILRAGKALK
jgi:T-complex protein 1 subunit zeta